jgi:type IV pilus assembly protein PilP
MKKSFIQSKRWLVYASLPLIFVLSGCSGQQDNLKAWIEQVKAKTVPIAPTIDPLKEYIVQPYASSNLPSPFSAVRVGQAQLETPPDGDRPRQPLEMIGLESIKYIGSMRSGGKSGSKLSGMVLIDGKVHTVRIGQYLGQDYGRITAINDQEIRLRELIKDGSNEWKEKTTIITLQGGGNETSP